MMAAASQTTDLIAFNFNLDQTDFFARFRKRGAADAPDLVGQTFMHELARDGDILSAEVMLNAGARIDAPDDEGRRPLHEAATAGQSDMVRFLLTQGALLDAPIHPFGVTALYLAVEQGHAGIAQDLIEKGANISVTHRLTGQGLLHLAAARGDMKLAGLLIAAGIDVLAEDRRGQTARDLASRGNHKALESVLLKVMQHHARR